MSRVNGNEIKAVLLDFDDTIIDTIKIFQTRVNQVLELFCKKQGRKIAISGRFGKKLYEIATRCLLLTR